MRELIVNAKRRDEELKELIVTERQGVEGAHSKGEIGS